MVPTVDYLHFGHNNCLFRNDQIFFLNRKNTHFFGIFSRSW